MRCLVYKKCVGLRTDVILECVFAKIHVNVQMYNNGLWCAKMFSAPSGSMHFSMSEYLQVFGNLSNSYRLSLLNKGLKCWIVL